MGAMRPIAPVKKGMGVGAIIGIIAAVLLIPILVLGILGIYGTRKYIANAKSAEARNTLGQIGRDAVTAYEREDVGANGKTVTHRICPSASASVPANRAAVSGKKYLATPGEWEVDKDRNAGFACLKFEMMMPQYFQYEYQATETGFTARAYGDLNGNGIYSTYELRGQVVGDQLRVAPAIAETNPTE